MNIVLLNLIMATATNGVIPRRKSIKDTMIANCAMGFVHNGHSVTILASEEFKPTEEETYDFKVVYFKSGLKRLFKPDLLPYPIGLCKYLKDNRDNIDMLVSSEVFSIGTLMAVTACCDKTVIWQEMAYHQKKWFKLPSRLWHNLVVRTFMHGALVVPRSEPAMRFISRYCSNVSHETVDHGANGDVLKPADAPDDSLIVMSRLTGLKNIDYIFNAFSRLVAIPKYAAFRLHLIGEGDQAEHLKKLADSLHISDNVIFHGFLRHSEVAHYLQHARAMLIATHRDLNLVSIPEAIISGTPVVTNTNVTTASYISEHGLGIARDDWDESDLIEVIENYPLYHKACLAVRDDLTREGSANKLLTIFLSSRK